MTVISGTRALLSRINSAWIRWHISRHKFERLHEVLHAKILCSLHTSHLNFAYEKKNITAINT